jgi:hypothetical protein
LVITKAGLNQSCIDVELEVDFGYGFVGGDSVDWNYCWVQESINNFVDGILFVSVDFVREATDGVREVVLTW